MQKFEFIMCMGMATVFLFLALMLIWDLKQSYRIAKLELHTGLVKPIDSKE